MRVLCMVPSWTETLLHCGVNVVGRTRFCIHPEPRVRSIPAVGGTKDIDWLKVKALKPDLMILDREENPIAMAEEAPCEVLATHVQHIHDVAPELMRLSQKTGAGKALEELAEQWREVQDQPARKFKNWESLPGAIEWIRKPDRASQAVYLIWREPWMSASRNTFIGSVLEKIGVEDLWQPPESADKKYPAFAFSEIPPQTILLCSSEPFPFAKPRFREELESSGYACAIVDGEAFSWFGVRSLNFLRHALELA